MLGVYVSQHLETCILKTNAVIAISSSGLVTNQYLITKPKEHNPIAYYYTEVNLSLMAMWYSRQDPSS